MKPAAHRVLFNGDCDFLFHHDYSRGAPRYHAGVFHDYVALLARSGVDTLVLNANAQAPMYPSRRLAPAWRGYTRGQRSFVRGSYPPLGPDFNQQQLDRALDRTCAMLDRYLDLEEDGVDWLAECCAACRRCGVSPWVSIRMNDAHGATNWSAAYANCPPQRDPALRLTGRALVPGDPAVPTQQLCDYAQPAVRDYYRTMIDELLTDYDFDGLELDWNRMPYVLEPDADDAGRQLITDWHRELRQLARRAGDRRGRWIYLGLRTPARVDHLHSVGLDLAGLARGDLIDFVAPANQWQMIWDLPVPQWRALLGEQVALYGSIDDAPNWMFARSADGQQRGWRLLSASAPLIHGAAANLLAAGCDGVEFFNFFCTDARSALHGAAGAAARYDAIAPVGQLAQLRGRPKHYSLQTAYGYWFNRWFELGEQLPVTLERGLVRTFHLVMSGEPDAAGRTLQVQLTIARPAGALPSRWPVVSFNGAWPVACGGPTDQLLAPVGEYTHHHERQVGLTYTLDARRLREGRNEFVVFDASDDPGPQLDGWAPGLRIVGFDVTVR